MGKPRLLMVIPAMHSFIQQDIDLLSERFSISMNTYNWRKKALAPFFLLAQAFTLLVKAPRSEVILVQFGGYWSLIPSLYGRLFNKRVYIILHGTDCASIPSLKYGSLRIPLLKWFCKQSYALATQLLPVSDSLVDTTNKFIDWEKPIRNGLKYHFPQLTTPIQVIPNGFDTDFWVPNEANRTEVITFLTVMSPAQFTLKGGDLIVQLAAEKPDFHFRFVGLDCPDGVHAPSNVTFLGRMNRESLRKEYQAANYYFQLSSYEGFGCALCEAMLCGCIPIVSEVNVLPQIVGITGVSVPFRRMSNLLISVQIIHNLSQGNNLNQAARERIKALFPLSNRKELLLKTLQSP
ncbi:glycosyltransferase family 4 protein [Mongoliitalea daihaiensis]|uniref:glycosyltransferase family 4 protein n=1 Tax=Mongoliitalea daihaiensis TaxID=2782006 RepID=UPI001F20A895|nr:glycosyltransferase family 4 protein [Mongoliitalea daihaiensis]UJP64410.1 glycosyltransferase family 4 protein [Mongoliitalea daihaiensis]